MKWYLVMKVTCSYKSGKGWTREQERSSGVYNRVRSCLGFSDRLLISADISLSGKSAILVPYVVNLLQSIVNDVVYPT